MSGTRRATAEFLATLLLACLGVVPAPAVQKSLASLKNPGLNLADTEQAERGYYEAILDAERRLDGAAPSFFSSDRTPAEAPSDAPLPFDADPRVMRVDDVRMYALKPNYRDLKRGVSWTTNSWGLRDREYLRTKPPGTIRIAFLGDSIGAGWGVDDGRSFESLLEAQLDAQSRAAGGPRVEILNFSVPGLAPGQRWENFLRLGGWSLGIDRVVYEATPAEPAWDERRLRVALPLGYGWDAPQYASAFARLSRRSTSDPLAIKQALRANRWILLESVYRHIASECRSHGVEATWVLIPRVGRTTEASERRRLCDLARRAGFAPIIDLSDAFNNQSAGALAVAPNDYHPNAKGHAILAERLSLSVELSSPTARETSP